MEIQTREKIINEFLSDSQFLKLADTYIPMVDQEGGVSYKEYFEKKAQNINNSEFLVPVLGIQGTGKSSLLNALLMDDLILPIDADETTCVPVEIRYGKENDGEIMVHFRDEKRAITLEDSKELEKYVHNRHNKGNEKNVSHIVVYKDDNLLTNNLVLVDLPGVGSLTPQNVKVTMNYVERLSAAIFLLRTVPPITRHEEIFLKNIWPKLTQAWFIQNQWNDESTEEVEDGKQHNEYVLKKIAEEHQTSTDIDIKVVNVYQALSAKLENDEEAYKESGLQEIRVFLYKISRSWRTVIREQFIESICLLIRNIKEEIQQQIDVVNMTTDELRIKQQEEEQKYEQVYQENKKVINKIEDIISSRKMELYDFASSESKTQMENLRNEMRRVIGSGLVDGHLLNRAYQDVEAEIADETMEELSLKIFEIQKELTRYLEELEIKNAKGQYKKVGSFYREEKIKFEKLFPHIGAVGGGAVGFKVGLAIGAAGGPVLSIIGGIVGIGIATAFGWLGNFGKKGVNKVRQIYTVRDLENPLRNFRDNLKDTIEGVADKSFSDIEEALTNFKHLQQNKIKKEKEKNLQQIMDHGKDVETNLAKLNQDFQKVLVYEGDING